MLGPSPRGRVSVPSQEHCFASLRRHSALPATNVQSREGDGTGGKCMLLISGQNSRGRVRHASMAPREWYVHGLRPTIATRSVLSRRVLVEALLADVVAAISAPGVYTTYTGWKALMALRVCTSMARVTSA